MSGVIAECQRLVQQVRRSRRTNLVSVLLHGRPGCGKSSLASRLALDSGFPFVRGVTARSLVGWSEQARVLKILKVFEDAYKSPLSVIVLDDLERLIDYSPVGPRYSNVVLQSLQTLINTPPPTECKLLVFATATDTNFLEELGVLSIFTAQQALPLVSGPAELAVVLAALGESELADRLDTKPVPIKTLINRIDYLKQQD